MPSKNRSIKQSIMNNERRQCSARGCTNQRYRIGAFCYACGRRKWYWGHPEARQILKDDYAYEKQLVTEVISKNPEHPGIQDVITFLDKYLEEAHKGHPVRFARHAARLYEKGAKGIDILIELSAIYLLSFRFHTKVKGDDHLIYLLGSKFLRFKPCPGKLKGPEHKAAGEFIRDTIGILLLNITMAAEKLEQQKDQNLTNMKRTLTV